jgi:rhamnosyl/mannosyltransferase
MRIVMVNKYYPPHIGGIEAHVCDLSEALVAAGCEVRVIVCNDKRRYVEESVHGVEVIRLPRLFERASTPVTRHFGSVLAHEAKAADVLHFHFPYPWGEFEWIGQPASKQAPFVVSYHSDIVRQKAALAVYRPFLNKFLDRARLILAASPQIIEYSPFLSSRVRKCRQVDYGLPLSRIADGADAIQRGRELRAEYGGRPLVLFVGRLVYYKGIAVLAEALPQINADFVVIGAGPDRGLLESAALRATAAGWQGSVRHIAYASDEDLCAWYHAADLLVLPSVESSEAFGLVQIEAAAAGIPSVSTRLTSGVPYANLDGVTGLTVTPGDAVALAGAINTLLADDALRSRLGRQARARALTQFTIPRMVKSVLAVYHEALA